MSNKQSLGAALAVVFVLVGLAYAGLHPMHPPAPGSLSGPDISSRYLNWGNVTEWNSGAALNSATSSVICSIPAPVATSTVLGIGLRVDSNGISGSQVLDIATSTTIYGTSTPAFVASGALPVAGGGTLAWQPILVASTTGATAAVFRSEAFTKGNTPFIINPNEYLNFRIATGTPGTFSTYVSGKCTARFQAL